MNNGKFVISLDFEMHWGFFDKRALDDSRSQLLNIHKVIDRLLQISKTYNVSITFATVGFLMAKDKEESMAYLPEKKPQYNNRVLDAYRLLNNIAPADQQFYFASDLVHEIHKDALHEIGTHTFSHYYCYEKGQTPQDFKDDLASAIAIANKLGVATKSIVFPRNQVLNDYLNVCEELGIETYRGHCKFNLYDDFREIKIKKYAMMVLRKFDSYFNISGSNSFKLEDYNSKTNTLINIPASRFLPPHNSKLKFMEPFKVDRIKKAMTKAAKRNEVYHLWWHPHNFANNLEENFMNLSEILQHYDTLKKTYNFESITMKKLGEDYRNS